MIKVEKVLLAAANDVNRYAANPLGPGYLTRADRWSEVIRYALDKHEKK